MNFDIIYIYMYLLLLLAIVGVYSKNKTHTLLCFNLLYLIVL